MKKEGKKVKTLILKKEIEEEEEESKVVAQLATATGTVVFDLF